MEGKGRKRKTGDGDAFDLTTINGGSEEGSGVRKTETGDRKMDKKGGTVDGGKGREAEYGDRKMDEKRV